LELKESEVPSGVVFAFFIGISAVGVLEVFGIGHWKDKAYAAQIESEKARARVEEVVALSNKAQAERDAAIAETAMCRRAIEHADRAVENLENALKRERGAK